MGLNISKKQSIIGNDIEDLTNLKQRAGMSNETIDSKLQAADLLNLLAPPDIDIEAEKKARQEASALFLTKHLAGKRLAHEAVAYLFDVGDSYQIEFPVGHPDSRTAIKARILLEGYEAHLGYLTSQRALIPSDSEGQIIGLITGRTIERTESDHDEFGNPGTIAYRDLESQRIVDFMTDEAKRLTVEA